MAQHPHHRRKPCCGCDVDAEISSKASGQQFISQYAKVSVRDFPAQTCKDLCQALSYRDKVFFARAEAEDASVELGSCPESVLEALKFLRSLDANSEANAFCRTRLDLLQLSFEMYKLENQDEEHEEMVQTDSCFDTVPKVDTHLHASAMMPAGLLARMMHKVYDTDKDRACGDKTIGAILEEAGYKCSADTAFSADKLNVRGSYMMFRDFSAFNAAFSPMGDKNIKSLFFGTDMLDGEYLYKVCLDSAERAKHQNVFLEPRFSIYGRKLDEWAKFATWVRKWNLPEIHEIIIGIQLPRIYPVWRKAGMVSSFGEFLTNFWGPVLEAAANPKAEGNEDIAWLLSYVRVIDTVDDESKYDSFEIADLPAPNDWTSTDNPPYGYYHYYMYANLQKLNALCLKNIAGYVEIVLRPHCGEAGETHHLITTFLFAQGISHGINLEKVPVMQYLYYLAQIPIAVSPMSNQVLFVKYSRNPFPLLFQRGLNVALSTDDPMMFHVTDNPLMEEYACARAAFDLDMIDMCEIARNSTRAAFCDSERAVLHGADRQDPNKTNIPRRRMLHRLKKLEDERLQLQSVAGVDSVNTTIKRFLDQSPVKELTRSEFRNMMTDIGCKVSDTELDMLLGMVKTTEDDKIDMKEVMEFLLAS